MPKYLHRMVVCLLFYLPVTVVLFYLPMATAQLFAPRLFPLHAPLDTISDVPVEVLLLHVSLPHLMELYRPRDSFKKLLEAWIHVVSSYLGPRFSVLACSPPLAPAVPPFSPPFLPPSSPPALSPRAWWSFSSVCHRFGV